MRPSADIWSLGVLAWEMVMGERLFLRGSEALTIKAVVEDHVPEVAAECDPELRSTIMRMLNRDPALRPSAQELEALTRGGRDVDDVAALQAMF